MPDNATPSGFVLVTGDISTGFTFTGPFSTRFAAENAQADYTIQTGLDAVIAPIYSPD